MTSSEPLEPGARGDAGRADVCLVAMPYADLPRPSLALSLLKAALEQAGIVTRVLYPGFWFAEEIGLRLYQTISQYTPTELLIGEWTFSRAAFPDAELDHEGFLRRIEERPSLVFGYGVKPGDGPRLAGELRGVAERTPGFVERMAERVVATGARIVGCTSTFQQQVASLALLRQVRRLAPELITLLGGANCEGAMGAAVNRCFPWVDFVVSGEADCLIADLCRRLLADGRQAPADRLPHGVFGPAERQRSLRALRIAGGGDATPRVAVEDMDGLPVPDFCDYFESLHASRLAPSIRPALLLETSRGCWWGAIKHCTFCGLNGGSMAYRSKSGERVVAEIHALEERHGISNFETVDNILDMAYFRTVLPRLAEEGRRRSFFYEVKANLKRHQVELLRRAGVAWIQPGIESFHTAVLELMEKGVKGWQNLQLLCWARELGVRLSWNLLWGFPGEEDSWYQEMATWLPLLEHLQPPVSMVRMRSDRFSVYHQRPEQFGLTLRPVTAMSYIYPVSPRERAELTYFFAVEGQADPLLGDGADPLEHRPGVMAVKLAVRRWRRSFRLGVPAVLALDDDGEQLRVLDTRSCAVERRAVLSGLERRLLLACLDGPRRANLAAVARTAGGPGAPPEDEAGDAAVSRVLDELERRRLVLALDGHLVALALRGGLPSLPKERDFPGGHVDLNNDCA